MGFSGSVNGTTKKPGFSDFTCSFKTSKFQATTAYFWKIVKMKKSLEFLFIVFYYMYLYFAVISYADVYSIALLVNLLTSCICLFIVIQCTFIMIVNVFIPGPYWKPTFVEWATLVKYCE